MKDNLLCAILAHTIKNPQAAADSLMKRFGSFTSVAEADVLAISDTLGGEGATSVYIKLVAAIVSRRNSDLFKFGKKHTDDEIERYFVSLFFGLSVETVYILSVKNGKIISCDKAGEGTVNASNVLPRRLLEIAKRHSADSLIIAHNHPGGYATPSDEDIAGTQTLCEFLRSSGINLLSHYVVAGVDCKKIDLTLK